MKQIISTIFLLSTVCYISFSQKIKTKEPILILVNGVAGDTLWMKRETLCKCEKIEINDTDYYLRSFLIGIDINGGIIEYQNDFEYLTGIARTRFCDKSKSIEKVALYNFVIYDKKRQAVQPFYSTIYINILE